jgi:hypothetical protein
MKRGPSRVHTLLTLSANVSAGSGQIPPGQCAYAFRLAVLDDAPEGFLQKEQTAAFEESNAGNEVFHRGIPPAITRFHFFASDPQVRWSLLCRSARRNN